MPPIRMSLFRERCAEYGLPREFYDYVTRSGEKSAFENAKEIH